MTALRPAPANDAREGGLLAWQWRGYPEFHRSRTNLVIHIFTVPLFWFGLLSLGSALAFDWRCAFGGLGAVAALVAQGRGHKTEKSPPIPFRSPFDLVARFFVEQMINFPLFVLSGSFWRAWKAAG